MSEYAMRVESAQLVRQRPNPIPLRAFSFVVHGDPMQQGSKFAFVNKYTHKAVMVDENSKELRQWRRAVIEAAREAFMRTFDKRDPFAAVGVDLTFQFLRPASHLNKLGEVRGSAPNEKITRPDLDKLVRATYDALTGSGIIHDDNAIVESHERKIFANHPGLVAKIWELQL